MNYFSNKSHVYTTAKTCEAMNSVDNTEVTLVSTDNSLVNNSAKIKFFKETGIQPFKVVSINSWSNLFKNSSYRLINWLETIMADLSMTYFVFVQRKNFNVLYFRDPTLFISIFMSKWLLRKPVFMEMHAILNANLKQKMTEFLVKHVDGLISISYGLKKYYDNINNKGIVSFCAASEFERFKNITESMEKLRDKYNLPKDKILIGYAGNLSYTGNYDSYGIEDIISTLPLLDKNIVFIGVGKKNFKEVEHLEKLATKLNVGSRVTFLPRVSKKEVAEYLTAFDILVHPKAGAKVANSPAKLFEWLSSGKPIIAANTQAISEILTDGKDALLVDYKDPKAWSNAINKIIEDKNIANRLVDSAKINSKQHTWKRRGEIITKFINENK